MRRYVPFLLALICIIFVFLAVLLYTNPFPKDSNNKFMPVAKTLTVYTTVPTDLASIIASEYQEENKVQIKFIPISKDELIEKINKGNNLDNADMVIADSTVLAKLAENDRLQAIASEQEDIIDVQFKDDNNRWIGIWYDPIVFCYNLDYVKNNWLIPVSWNELAQNPNVKIAMTDFMVASAAANILYSLTTSKGETETLNIMRNLHPKIVRYAKYLSTPVRMAGMGEADLGISVQSEAIRYINDNYPLGIIYPEDGVPYRLIGVGILSNSSQVNEAGTFVNWLLSDNVQIVLQRNKYYFVPTNYSLTAYKEFAGKNMNLIDNKANLDEQAQKVLLDKWVKNIRLKQ